MNSVDLHHQLDRLVADEPHLPAADPLAAGTRALRRRRQKAAGGILAGAVAVAAVLGVTTGASPRGADDSVEDPGTAAGAPPAPAPPAAPEPKQPDVTSYSWGLEPGCVGYSDCTSFVFEMDAARAPKVATIVVRLVDGSVRRVATTDGAYQLEVRGELPDGYRWDPDKMMLIGPDGYISSMIERITLLAKGGTELATGSPGASEALEAYPELCSFGSTPPDARTSKTSTCVGQ